MLGGRGARRTTGEVRSFPGKVERLPEMARTSGKWPGSHWLSAPRHATPILEIPRKTHNIEEEEEQVHLSTISLFLCY